MASITICNLDDDIKQRLRVRAVERWLAGHDGAKIYFTTVGEAELRHSVVILPAGKRRNALTTGIEGLLEEDFRAREATVATRNTSDYEGCGV